MYTYQNLINDCNRLEKQGITCGSIGTSEKGLAIPYLHIGSKASKQIIIQGAIHAREWHTALLVIEQVEFVFKQKLDIEKKGGIYFLPMTNPDGNAIVECGNKLHKANANGVDLNTNFDAAWGHGTQNIRVPSSSDYIGSAPFCQKETRALRDFTLQVRPSLTLSYHAKGQEIYYLFNQTKEQKQRDRQIAVFVANQLGYKLVENVGGPQYPVVSSGGYKDWCISSLGIPSLTIEIISDDFEHPLEQEALSPEEINSHLDLPIKLLELI
ncbi:MAG: hypothetical protein FWC80_06395 [Firmicutes bacterium]|nr:hypothetical protein [Bacillota bacterium]